MKKYDFLVILFVGLIIAFFLIPASLNFYNNAYNNFPLLLSFIKFAILATFGEMLVLRLKKGYYLSKDFGLLPKMFVWGILGMFIYWAFGIFSQGVNLTFLKGIEINTFPLKILNAFLISFFMNIIFAPIMMTTHKVTDLHIAENSGHFPLNNFKPSKLLPKIDWNQLWGFVFKKTIPLFWIPAHTITFLLPAEFRVLFAALLSVFLGLFLAFAKK